jgi:hypothetical protein
MTRRPLTIAAAAFAALPARARRTALDTISAEAVACRDWAVDKCSHPSTRRWHREDAAAFEAAVELLRAAEAVPVAKRKSRLVRISERPFSPESVEATRRMAKAIAGKSHGALKKKAMKR